MKVDTEQAFDLDCLKIEISGFNNFCETIVNNFSNHSYAEHTFAYIVQTGIYYRFIFNMFPIIESENKIEEFEFLTSIDNLDPIKLFQFAFIKSRNRTFCVESSSHFEEDLISFCVDKKIKVKTSNHKCITNKCCLKNRKTINVKYYVDKILQFNRVTGEVKKSWQAFFEAVSLIRNRGAHSNKKLSNADRIKLENGGLDTAFNEEDNSLKIGLIEQEHILQKFMDFISAYCK